MKFLILISYIFSLIHSQTEFIIGSEENTSVLKNQISGNCYPQYLLKSENKIERRNF